MRSDTDAGHWVFEDGVGPTIDLDISQAISGCTVYGISATTTGEHVDFAVSAGREMRCELDIEDPFDGRFGAVLRSIDGLQRHGGRIVLTGEGIRLVLATTMRLY